LHLHRCDIVSVRDKPGGIMRSGHTRLPGVLAAAALTLALTGCGSDVETSEADTASESDATGAAVTAAPQSAGGDDDEVEAADDQELELGFEIRGPAGTVIETTTVAVADGTAQSDLDQVWELAGEPEGLLFTTFIDSAEVTVEVTEGGPVTIVGFRGTLNDAEDPFGGYAIAEELATLDVEVGAASVLSIP
jgi:hypothetical protein